MQTMPSFVYLLPAFVLFDASRFTAIVAAIDLRRPAGHPARRRRPPRGLADRSRRRRSRPGASSRQRLTKVQLPVARPALQLAANQAVILVLSMVVVGGLVGGQALGYDVVAGFSQNRLSAWAWPRGSRSSCSGSCSTG